MRYGLRGKCEKREVVVGFAKNYILRENGIRTRRIILKKKYMDAYVQYIKIV